VSPHAYRLRARSKEGSAGRARGQSCSFSDPPPRFEGASDASELTIPARSCLQTPGPHGPKATQNRPNGLWTAGVGAGLLLVALRCGGAESVLWAPAWRWPVRRRPQHTLSPPPADLRFAQAHDSAETLPHDAYPPNCPSVQACRASAAGSYRGPGDGGGCIGGCACTDLLPQERGERRPALLTHVPVDRDARTALGSRCGMRLFLETAAKHGSVSCLAAAVASYG
jgi:hypothetical protein